MIKTIQGKDLIRQGLHGVAVPVAGPYRLHRGPGPGGGGQRGEQKGTVG